MVQESSPPLAQYDHNKPLGRYITLYVEQKQTEMHFELITLEMDHNGLSLLLHTEMEPESDRYRIYPSITKYYSISI